jgi:hypothetical protein
MVSKTGTQGGVFGVIVSWCVSRVFADIPRWCIASETRYSRMLERSTARPSPPREKGVVPPPLSCSSHRFPFSHTTSPNPCARPSPYALPRPKGSADAGGEPRLNL